MTVTGRPTIAIDRYRARLDRAAAVTGEVGLQAMLVGVGPDLRYLTGYEAMPLERMTMLVVGPDPDGITLVVPRLEEPAARAGCRPDIRIVTWEENDDPHGLVAGLVRGREPSSALRMGVSDRLIAMHLLRLQRALPGATFESAATVLRELRMTKDPDEVALLRTAAHAADRVVTQIAAGDPQSPRRVAAVPVDGAADVEDDRLAGLDDPVRGRMVWRGGIWPRADDRE